MVTITAQVFDKTSGKAISGLTGYIGYADGHVAYATTGRDIYDTITDNNGCITHQVNSIGRAVLEIGFHTGNYWRAQNHISNPILERETVVRFDTVKQGTNPTYHVSLTIEPNDFSGTIT